MGGKGGGAAEGKRRGQTWGNGSEDGIVGGPGVIDLDVEAALGIELGVASLAWTALLSKSCSMISAYVTSAGEIEWDMR